MRYIFVIVFAVMLSMSLLPEQVFAQDRPTISLMQHRLSELGFDTGEPDGQIGPRTQSAISSYAKARDIPPTADAVLADFFERSVQAREVVVLSEVERERLEAVIRQNLTDPVSAIFEEEIFRYGNVYCGQVNARNLFGGYVGRRYFQVFGADISGLPLSFGFLGLDDERMGVNWFRCNTKF